ACGELVDYSEPIKPGCYNIGFINNDEYDQTQFDIYPGQTASDLVDLWEGFLDENGLDETCVDYVDFVGPDEHMKTEIKDILKNGLVIIRDVNEEGLNIYLSPEDVAYVAQKLKESRYNAITETDEENK
ncbi:MAG: hypothetical protein J5966_05140, partial [Lachnospiraceae bacterium]|nr:hypothetical protein [Lachnospiraceae bacterium]